MAMEKVMAAMRVSAERKHLDLNMILPQPEKTMVWGNESLLHQVLMNLIGNAIKFTSRGVVSLEGSYEQMTDTDLRMKMVVRDTGRGIEAKEIGQIFEEFHQIDPYKDEGIPQGSGLGLAIVKKIIQQHQGHIEVESVPEKGSVFSFEIPYKVVTSIPNEQQGDVGRKKEISDLQVIIVENELLHRKYLTILLSNEGAQIHEALNGQEALGLLNAHKIDLVLTDINMPGMDGVALTKLMRQHPEPEKALVPVIALTATISPEDIAIYREAGMNNYLIKPFTPEELLSKIRELL